jgi:hypothetical protein
VFHSERCKVTEVGPGREWSAEPSAAVSTLQRECSYPVTVDDGVIMYHVHRWSVNTSAWVGSYKSRIYLV